MRVEHRAVQECPPLTLLREEFIDLVTDTFLPGLGVFHDLAQLGVFLAPHLDHLAGFRRELDRRGDGGGGVGMPAYRTGRNRLLMSTPLSRMAASLTNRRVSRRTLGTG